MSNSAKDRLVQTIIFGLVILLLGLDIAEDLESGSSISHVTQEVIIVILGLAGILYLWRQYFSFMGTNKQLKTDLARAREDLKYFKDETKNLTEGLSQKIDEQLDKWKLSRAEKDICLLILKGLSNKEIADIRSTTEKTVRHQATSIYSKSNLTGRSELIAFFLEDLLVLQD